MLNPFGRDIGQGSYVGLQKRLMRRLDTGRVGERIVEIFHLAYTDALNAENVVLTQGEKKKLRADIWNSLVNEITRQVQEGSRS